MTIADLIKDFIDTSKERLKTPISGAFLWSFLIYNWRPLAVLLFSEASIENKIVVINHEYCNVWAMLIPIGMAFVYTIGVPMLMVKIDKILTKTKEARIKKIYADKGNIMDGKILIAGKEFELKNKESGNKQIEELLNQIKGLEDSNSQMATAHNNTVNRLNKELDNVNKENELYRLHGDIDPLVKEQTPKAKFALENHLNDIYDSIKKNLTNHEIEQLYDIHLVHNNIKTSNLIFSDDTLNKFQNQGLITVENGKTKLTTFGLELLNTIKEPNKKPPLIVNSKKIK